MKRNKVQEVFERMEGVTVIVDEGHTDEGEVWFSSGRFTITIDTSVRLFEGWDLISETESVEDLLSTLLKVNE
jgi:hypothetical protein